MNYHKFSGHICKGCSQCIKGAKLVLFITGKCPNNCFYCPLGEEVKGRDLVFANERPVNCDDDLITEATIMNAMGAGITGGEPLLDVGRVVYYIKLLKSVFGKKFHIHLYTAKPDVSDDELRMLESSGLDELRIHPVNFSDKYKTLITRALKHSFKVGVEVPAFPNKESELVKLGNYLRGVNADFLNLNELEFNESNCSKLKQYSLNTDSISSVNGSESVALNVIKRVSGFNIHYCSAGLKDGLQFRNRLLRTAKNVARDFESITVDGTIIKGVVSGCKKDLIAIKKGVIVNNCLELSPAFVERNFKKHPKLSFSLVEYMPTFDRLVVSVVPLGNLQK